MLRLRWRTHLQLHQLLVKGEVQKLPMLTCPWPAQQTEENVERSSHHPLDQGLALDRPKKPSGLLQWSFKMIVADLIFVRFFLLPRSACVSESCEHL